MITTGLTGTDDQSALTSQQLAQGVMKYMYAAREAMTALLPSAPERYRHSTSQQSYRHKVYSVGARAALLNTLRGHTPVRLQRGELFPAVVASKRAKHYIAQLPAPPLPNTSNAQRTAACMPRYTRCWCWAERRCCADGMLSDG